jgi:hypothetical protein
MAGHRTSNIFGVSPRSLTIFHQISGGSPRSLTFLHDSRALRRASRCAGCSRSAPPSPQLILAVPIRNQSNIKRRARKVPPLFCSGDHRSPHANKKAKARTRGNRGLRDSRHAIGVELIGVLEFTLARLLASCGIKLLPNSPNMLGEARHPQAV